ncbi:MAG: hypothetical protein ACE5GE_04335 [Phycisphaerae bacterium]
MSITRHDHKGRVYVRFARPVKQQARGGKARWSLVLWVGALGWGTGCATPGIGVRAVPYPVAMSYNAELAYLVFPDQADAVIRADFAEIGKLGFDTVVLRHLARDRESDVSTAVRDAGLRLAATPAPVQSFLRTGQYPTKCRSVDDLVARCHTADGPSVWILGPLTDASSGERAQQVAKACRWLNPAPVTLAYLADRAVEPAVDSAVDLLAATMDPAPMKRSGGLMLLDCRRDANVPVADAPPEWLARYHAGLAAGLTGGLIVQGFRAVPGTRRGLAGMDDRGGYDVSTGLRRLTDRARQWGPRLRRSHPQPLQSANSVDPALQLVLFVSSKRRLVLLHNTATDRYVRGQALLAPDSTATERVLRAVQVPANALQITGLVIQAKTRGLTLPFDLAPGDATLWELF